MIILNENLRLTANSFNFIVERKNKSVDDFTDENDDKKGLWKKTYHSSFKSVFNMVEKIDKDASLMIFDINSSIKDIESIIAEKNHRKTYSIHIDRDYVISNNRYGFTIDYGNGKLRYMNSSAYVFSDILSHELTDILCQDTETTVDEIMVALESVKNMVLNAEFNEIVISSKTEDEDEEELGDEDNE